MKIRRLTKEEEASWPKEVIVPLARPFSDARGEIQPLVDLMMESAVLIHSNRGAIRANHYHRTDWHFCYVLSGAIEYWHRPTGSDRQAKKIMVRQGQLFFTPPMVDHAMVFPKKSSFLVLGRNSRAQAVYEADVVRIAPINR